ncbi:MAG TPA: alpha/beta hydrolase-fold protein [Kofleriaceae bacterium]
MPVHRHRHTSQVLAGNPLGDPIERDLYVYVPPDYDPDRRYPAVLAIVGFTGTGGYHFNVDPLTESLDRRLDRLIASGACPPVIVAAPDCFTRVGGNQHINSAGTGRYEDYVCDEIIPFVDGHYATLPRGRWGVFGKSSGGYGAIVLGMRRPDVFCALADHSGDACFELCYLADFGPALDAFREAGGPQAWLDAFWRDPNHYRERFMKPLEMLAMAAHFSPNADAPVAHARIDWPFDLETGEFQPAVWERWRAWDPVNMVDAHAGALRKLRAIYVDAGTRDEFALHWGARALVKKLRSHGIAVTHEEFDDGHMNIPYRYDASLPILVRAILQ